MTTAKRAQALALNSEISNSIAKTESENREGNENENDELLCERDKKPHPRGIDPRGRKMPVNPLRTADEINR